MKLLLFVLFLINVAGFSLAYSNTLTAQAVTEGAKAESEDDDSEEEDTDDLPELESDDEEVESEEEKEVEQYNSLKDQLLSWSFFYLYF